MTDDLMPLSEVEYRAGREGRQGGVELVTAIDGKSIYAQDGFDRAVRIDPRILAVCHNVLIFVDAGSWAVRHITALPKIDVSECIRGDLNTYPGGFTAVDAEYDERLDDVLRPDLADTFERIWQDAINADPESVALSTVTATLARSFSAFAGMSLSIASADADRVVVSLPKLTNRGFPVDPYKSRAEAIAAMRNWIQSAPNERPRSENDRDGFATHHKIGRDRGREIWREEKAKLDAKHSD